jgi:hypothetical protein
MEKHVVLVDQSPKPFHLEQQFLFRDRLPMWVVCRPTTDDFPGYWTARMHLCLPEAQVTNLLILGRSLEGVRKQLPPNLSNIGRNAHDDDVIEEVWL